MPNEVQKDPRTSFTVRFLPWLLGAAMLVVYLATLNPWVALLNLNWMAAVSGMSWQVQLTNPLLYLVTRPFHLAPAAAVPWCLNVFSALCAAGILGLLARCVALLPHDRLEAERQRERSGFAFMTGPLAVFPPVAAVLLLGLQLTFWEHATNFTGESFELLIFAGIVWQLLEYRLDEAPGRLYLAGFGCGALMAESWSFLGYFPVFITAIVWLRGLDFFNIRFLARLLWSGLAGLGFLFLLPLVSLISGKYSNAFWEVLRPALGMDWGVLCLVANHYLWRQLLLISVSTFVPLLVLSIRWSPNFGDSGGPATALVNYLFYLANLGFLALGAWVMFDPPFSPKYLSPTGTPGLTFYWLAALALGYFCGFALVVFGKKPGPQRRGGPRVEPLLPAGWLWLCPLIVAGTLALAAAASLLLAYKNLPIIRAQNGDTLLKYARFATQNLPPGGAILLSDTDATRHQPTRGYLVEAMLAREGKWARYPVVDTSSLKYTVYEEFLHTRHPGVWPDQFKGTPPGILSEPGLLQIISGLAKSNAICYLNPSFGYYFETYYQEPHGLAYELKRLPGDTLLPPPPEAALLRENQQFWADVIATAQPAVQAAAQPPSPPSAPNLADQLLARLHVAPEPDDNAIYAGTLYALGLDDWGVRLERAGELAAAATNFLAAQAFNPDNLSAGINLEFNRQLQAGKTPAIDLTRIHSEEFGKLHSWEELLALDGPVDDPSFVYEDALLLSRRGGLLRQAIAQLDRVRQLAPDRFDVRQRLANAYLLNHLPDPALAVLRDPMTAPDRFALSAGDVTTLNTLAAAAWFQKGEKQRGVELLERTLARQPDNTNLVAAAVQAFLQMGFCTNALPLIDRQLRKTPDDPQWVFDRGYVELRLGQTAPAIAAFTRVLTLSTNQPAALFNRALAYLNTGRLAEARADYLQLQALRPDSSQAAFGLGEIAWRQRDTNAAIRNYGIYLANTRTNTAEATNVMARLHDLGK